MRGRIINFMLIIAALLVGSGVTYAVIANPFNNAQQAGALGCQYTACQNRVIVDNTGISSSVDKAYDAVVMIKNIQQGQVAGTGSGFVYKTDQKYGYIITNYHVVSGSQEVEVVTTKEKKVTAKLLGGDEYIDIAVVRIPIESVVKVSEIGKTDELKLGDFVFTIGSPVGEEYFNSITSGIVSGFNRKVLVSVNSTDDWIMDVIQLDAAINPGNSGGPLLNSNGEVIGVNSLKLANYNTNIENMGFAIKIEDALAHIETFEQGKEIERPMLGISILNTEDVYSLLQYNIKLDDGSKDGVVVVSVQEGSGADKAGLKKGDIIIKVDDEEISDHAYLKYILYKYNIGDKLNITYIREGKIKTTKLTLTKYED